MKQLRSMLLVAAVALGAIVAVLPNFGCAGTSARQYVGVPAVVLASGGVASDAHAGVLTLPSDQQAPAQADVDAWSAAVASKDRQTIATEAWPRWPVVRTLAEKGIADQEAKRVIGPGVAASLMERLNQTESVLGKIVNH